MVLVDGSAMMFRAFYALPANLQTSSGQPTNAILGFATMFRKLFSGRAPDLGAVVFDAPGPTFRDARYAEYKATREAPPDDLLSQRPFIDRLVEAHGFPLLRVPGYEADDVIGTLATRGAARGCDVVIVSSDKDFVQLIGERIKMYDAMKDVTYDAALARKKWGVAPERFVDLLSLMGDKIDNIPGVPGIGQKGATELIEAYGDLESILGAVGELSGRKQSALQKHAEDARLSKELALIDLKVPLPVALDDLELPAPRQDALAALFTELEMYSMLTEEAVRAAEEDAEADVEIRVLEGDVLSEWLGAAAGLVALEPVFDEPTATPEALVGLALATGAEEAIYVDLRGPLPEALVGFLESEARPKLAHDGKLSFVTLGERGVRLAGLVADTQLASFLVDPAKLLPHRLDQVSKEYVRRPLPPAKRITGSGKGEKKFRELSPEAIAPWAGRRALTIREAWPKLEAALEREGQSAQLSEVDIPLSELLARMERAGIGVDAELLGVIEGELEQRLEKLEQTIHGHAGRGFNIASTKQLSEVLFEEMKLPVIKRTKTGYSTNAEVLERLAVEHPIARDLLEHRKLSKLVTTYTRVLRAAVREGRVHATFQQTTGVTGRLISTDPDLQRTPIKTPEGERIRHAFVPAPGQVMVSADWSQIELRLLAHVSKDPGLLSAFAEHQDVHARTASELFGVAIEEVSRDQRRVGKTVNFATVYGQGATALGQILSIPRAEAQKYIEGYFEAYAGVRAWLDATIEEARERGFVQTLSGRRRYIPELSSRSMMERAGGERIAANTPIQGSAADICKAAMLAIDAELRQRGLASRMVLQIHDELLFDTPETETETVMEIARRHMSTAADLSVELVVEVGRGASWGEAH